MARVLAISSQVVYGPVGLNCIVPALQSGGHEVLAIPTILLSNHPGHGKPEGRATAAAEMSAMITTLKKLGAFENLDAIITGYFASAEQIEIVAAFIAKLKCSIVLIDPVLGDHGKLYVGEAVAQAIRDKLLPLATIVTPNAFELSWLTGLPIGSSKEAVHAARRLSPRLPARLRDQGVRRRDDDRLVVLAEPRRRTPQRSGHRGPRTGAAACAPWKSRRSASRPVAAGVPRPPFGSGASPGPFWR